MWDHWNLWTWRSHMIKKTENMVTISEMNRIGKCMRWVDQIQGYWSSLLCNVKPRSNLFFKHDFIEISIQKFRENSLMNCIYISPNVNHFQHFAKLISICTTPPISTPFVSLCFLQYFKANMRYTISPETNFRLHLQLIRTFFFLLLSTKQYT